MKNKKKPEFRAHIGWGGAKPGSSIENAMATAQYGLLDMEEANFRSPPDIFVIDVRSAEKPVAVAGERLRQARRHAPMSGAIIYASRNETPPNRKALAVIGDVVFADERHTSLVLAIRDRLRLGALAEETSERIRSLSASASVTAFPDLAAPTNSLSVLIAGKPSPAVLAAANMLQAKGFKTPCVFSAGHAMRTLETDAIDSAIFLPEDETDVLISLARALKRHRSFRKTPVLVVGTKEDVTSNWFDGDAFDLIYTDHLDTNLIYRIERATRRARLSSVMAAFISTCDGHGVRDRVSGAYSANFFTHHGARLHRRLNETSHPLSVVGIGLDDCASKEERNRLMRQAVKIIGRITRPQDMAVRLTPHQLAVLLPNVISDDAASIAARLQGVLSASIRHKGSISVAYCHARENLEETIAMLLSRLANAQSIDGVSSS